MSKRRRQKADRAKTAAARRRKKSKRKYTLYYLIALVLVLAVGAALSLTVFFQVERITVEGTSRYADEELIASSGISIGDNLFRLPAADVAGRLVESHPYLSKVSVRRVLPDQVTLVVTQAEPAAAVENEAGVWLLSKEGRVLESGLVGVPEGFARSVGLELGELGPGDYLLREKEELAAIGKLPDEQQEAALAALEQRRERKQRFDILIELIEAAAQQELSDVEVIDVSQELSLRMLIDGRLSVELGSRIDMEPKLRMVKTVLERTGEEESEFVGEIDATSHGRVYQRPKDIFEPAKWKYPQWLLADYERAIVRPPVWVPEELQPKPEPDPEPQPQPQPQPESQPPASEPPPAAELPPQAGSDAVSLPAQPVVVPLPVD